MTEKATMTRQETADYLSIGLSSLDKLIRRRENPLPHIQIGRRVVIPAKQLEAWFEAETEREAGEV